MTKNYTPKEYHKAEKRLNQAIREIVEAVIEFEVIQASIEGMDPHFGYQVEYVTDEINDSVKAQTRKMR